MTLIAKMYVNIKTDFSRELLLRLNSIVFEYVNKYFQAIIILGLWIYCAVTLPKFFHDHLVQYMPSMFFLSSWCLPIKVLVGRCACNPVTRKATVITSSFYSVSLNTPCCDCKTWTSMHPALDVYLPWQNAISSCWLEYFFLLIWHVLKCALNKHERTWSMIDVLSHFTIHK